MRSSFSTTQDTELNSRAFESFDDKGDSEIILVLACLQENAKVGTKKVMAKMFVPRFVFRNILRNTLGKIALFVS